MVLDLIGRYPYFRSGQQSKLTIIYKLCYWSVYELLKKEVAFSTPDGTRFVSMPNNFSSLAVYVRDFRDPAIQKFMERVIKKGSTFVDAGANIGTYTLRASTLVGKEGRVIAVEAHPFTYKYLLRNIKTAKLTNVEPIEVALGSEHGEIKISYTDTNAGETHVAVGGEKSVSVPVRTLDEILKDRNIAKIDYLKIDVEGFEYALLVGAKNIITASKKIIIQTELNVTLASRYNHSLEDTIKLLQSFRLTPHNINQDGTDQITNLSNPGEDDVLWWREDSSINTL